jgi:hypothetical protein
MESMRVSMPMVPCESVKREVGRKGKMREGGKSTEFYATNEE